MTPRPLAASVAVALLLVTACNQSENTRPTPSPTASTTTQPATTAPATTPPTTAQPTPSPTPTTAPATASTIAAPTTTVPAGTLADDWLEVMQTLGARRQALYTDPDVAGIGGVCAASSQCFEQLDVQLGDMAEKGWKIEGADPFTVLSATIEKYDGATLDTSLLVTLIVTVQRPSLAGVIVDATGTEIAKIQPETEAGLNTESRAILARIGPDDDPWRLVSQDRLREVAG